MTGGLCALLRGGLRTLYIDLHHLTLRNYLPVDDGKVKDADNADQAESTLNQAIVL